MKLLSVQDEHRERIIAALLRYGTWLASALVAAGIPAHMTRATFGDSYDLIADAATITACSRAKRTQWAMPSACRIGFTMCHLGSGQVLESRRQQMKLHTG